jgi:hypothetical protein
LYELSNRLPSGFWTNSAQSCVRVITDISTQCATDFAVSTFTNFGLAISPNETFNIIPLQIVSITDNSGNASANGTDLTPPTTAFDGNSCNNAVLQVINPFYCLLTVK